MLTYWLLFLVPAWMALSESSRTQSVRSRYWGAQWVLAWVLLTCIVGWRHDVGGDWLNYLGHYEEALDTPLPLAFAKDDPGYLASVAYEEVIGAVDHIQRSSQLSC